VKSFEHSLQARAPLGCVAAEGHCKSLQRSRRSDGLEARPQVSAEPVTMMIMPRLARPIERYPSLKGSLLQETTLRMQLRPGCSHVRPPRGSKHLSLKNTKREGIVSRPWCRGPFLKKPARAALVTPCINFYTVLLVIPGMDQGADLSKRCSWSKASSSSLLPIQEELLSLSSCARTSA